MNEALNYILPRQKLHKDLQNPNLRTHSLKTKVAKTREKRNPIGTEEYKGAEVTLNLNSSSKFFLFK